MNFSYSSYRFQGTPALVSTMMTSAPAFFILGTHSRIAFISLLAFVPIKLSPSTSSSKFEFTTPSMPIITLDVFFKIYGFMFCEIRGQFEHVRFENKKGKFAS